MDVNKITQELLAAGYTAKDTPPGMRPYNQFYGGWEYEPKALYKMVFETPCKLLLKGGHFVGGYMSYMGVDWMPENDNPIVCCPRFGQGPCELNHELLRDRAMLREKIVHCACHMTHREYDYDCSYEKAHDDVWKESDALFEEFSKKKHGRTCRQCSSYDRTTKAWEMHYNPMIECARGYCTFCTVMQKELSPKKGNVFYDVKVSQIKKAIGLFPDEHKVTILKGKKLLNCTVSLTICEAIAKMCKEKILDNEIRKRHSELHFDPSITVEVLNIRAERRETRDLMQDLSDVAEGIEIIHAGDAIKAAAQQKRERRAAIEDRRITRLERLILENGFEGLEGIDKSRAEKKLDWKRIEALEIQRNKPPPPNEEPEQMSLF